MTSPTPVDYVGRDWADIRAAIIERIPVHLPEWNTLDEHDFGVVLIELFAYIADQLNFYIDRTLNESSLQTAVLRDSVEAFASMVGYLPSEAVPASGTVTFTGSAGSVIPEGTVVYTRLVGSDSPPLPFTTTEDATIVAATIDVPVTQGQSISDEVIGTASGWSGERFVLSRPGVVRESVVIDVVVGTAVRWTRVDSLLSAGSTDKVYSVHTDSNGATYISFGDGANGSLLPPGATVEANYWTADGAAGNVGIGVVSQLSTVIAGVASVTNAAAMSGGSDHETIDEMRKSIPRSLQAVNRAVALADYAPLAEQVPGVQHASAEAAVYTNVTVYVIPVGGGPASPTLLDAVDAYFADDRTLHGVTVVSETGTYVPIDISVDVTAMDTYYAADVELAVADAISELFNLADLELAGTILLGDVYHAVLHVPGVQYGEVTVLARDAGVTVTQPVLTASEIPEAGTISVTVSGGL